MHPRITELLEYNKRQATKLRQAYDAVPTHQRAVRVDPKRWSPAEVIDHLAIVERGLAKRLDALIAQARALPPEHDSSPILPTMELTKVVNRTKRFVTSEAAEPKNNDPNRVWADFESARSALVEVIQSCNGLALGGVSAPHPALGTLNGYEWIAFAGAHAARHADQIREMMAAR